MFVNKTVFISEQIKEYRFGGLLEIRDKFSTNVYVLSFMILWCWLNILENFTLMYDFEKHSGLLERP